MKHIAFILAGGTGSRVGGDMPKQFLPLADGRSVLEHSVDAFEQSHYIHEIVVVMHSDWLKEAEELIRKNAWRKVKHLISGGNERWESSWNGIALYLKEDKKDPDTFYWFHDAARPFVSQDIISRVAEALKSHLAVTVAVPVTDTLYQIKGHEVTDIRNRKEFMRAQTPQAFHYLAISPAYMRAIEKGKIKATDDVGILMQYNPDVEVYFVEGEEANKKITYKEDLCDK
ncbi:MAG: 2-C-methyl-D-erythritol 4-phosphate cytidylyltransferase [Paludibacteraceae bacterium]|nr:2-C-methyl-D-erythritol 4-phosphate cytidylyltransferase [Paludibacteraceae bacterium]